MRTRFLGAAALIFAGLLTGCNQLTQYTLSEQDVNQYLQKHNQFEKQIGVPGLVDARIVLTKLNSEIGRSQPDRVTLKGHAAISITSLLGPQQAEMDLTMEARPEFDNEKKAVYLRDLQLTGSEVQPPKMQGVMNTLDPYLNQALKSYFDQRPAYVLSADRSKGEALAMRLAKGLEVKPGELVIPFTQ